MAWVVGHARDVLDHLSHPRQRPHIRQVAVGFGAVDQRVRDLGRVDSSLSFGLRPAGPALRKASRPPCRHALRHSETT